MSYILDALKKSESERQRQQAPGFADLPGRGGRRGTPLWVWLVGGLLLINAGVLVVFLLRPGLPTGVAAETPIARPVPIERAPQAFDDVVREAREAAHGTARDDEPQLAAETEAARAMAAVSGEAAVDNAASATGSGPARATDSIQQPVPTFMELRANGEFQLPDLHLDIHVFSETPGERFVFINMNKYREQATLEEGPKLLEITRDGVRLRHAGSEFMLPRD